MIHDLVAVHDFDVSWLIIEGHLNLVISDLVASFDFCKINVDLYFACVVCPAKFLKRFFLRDPFQSSLDLIDWANV